MNTPAATAVTIGPPKTMPARVIVRERDDSTTWAKRGTCLVIGSGLVGQEKVDWVNLFYPTRESTIAQINQARMVCVDCPVREECLEYALANDEKNGVWGGKTADERIREKAIRRARNAPRMS